MMLPRFRYALALLVAVLLIAGSVQAADLADSLKKGTPDAQSIGALAFAPDGVLFFGDSRGAAIFAIDTGDRSPSSGAGAINIPGIGAQIASMLGTTEKEIIVNDLAVNPSSGNAYLSISRGRGPDAGAVLLRINRENKIDEVPLKDIKFAKARLPNAATGKARQDVITHLAFVDGRVFVSGLSNEEFASQLRAIPFPFSETEKGTAVEIYHGSHGRFETNSPVRTFVTFDINGEQNILAAYTCTPLVKIPVAQLKPGSRVKGTTIAELGNMNRPLDMIVYEKDGKNYILMSNSSRGLMKITTHDIDKIKGIESPVKGKAGLTYESIAEAKGIQQLDRLDKDNALVLVRTESGSLDLKTMPLP
jgi:hypothetical protein